MPSRTKRSGRVRDFTPLADGTTEFLNQRWLSMPWNRRSGRVRGIMSLLAANFA